jgi:hypothetical protein
MVKIRQRACVYRCKHLPMKYPWLYLLALLTCSSVWAQKDSLRTASRLIVKRTSSPVVIDGSGDEAAWSEAGVTSPFVNKWPTDSGYAEAQTQVKLLFDNNFIYVLAVNYQKKEDLVIRTLKRDQLDAFWGSDGFSVVLDPFHQQNNGFMFSLNAGGAQMEGTLNLRGAWTVTSENWDNKWFSAVTVHDEYWVAEMAIPFSALRFRKEAAEWGINFVRNDMKRNAYSVWSPVPLQMNGTDLGHMGVLQWDEPITPTRSLVTLIPFATSAHTRNHEDDEAAITGASGGLDAKVTLSSSMNLDLTVRPDFSNVDVDQQLTNVTRYSLFFPERRNFFLENADLFSNYGSWQVRPFFSRRIGLQDGEPIPIALGARLTGNVSKGLRIGVMDVQTRATKDYSANNYLVAALQQNIWKRSSVKVFTSNRSTTLSVEDDDRHDYNRTYGAEFQYISADGKWNAALRAHGARTPEKLSDNEYLSVQTSYLDRRFYAGLMVEDLGENYINDIAFIPRLENYDAERDTTIRIGQYIVNPWIGLLIRPKNSSVNLIEPNSWSVITYRKDGSLLERNTSVNVSVIMKSTEEFFVEAFNTEVNLPFPTELIDADRYENLPARHYNFTHYSASYSSDSRKRISGSLKAGWGTFYNGTRTEYVATLMARVQPWGNFGMSYSQNDIRLPGEYGSAQYILVGPKAEISFSNTMAWTTFVQYNTQSENVNINSRFQWRYRPMSDIFLVYSDNYTSTDFTVKNRGVVLKMTYWLNL